MMNDFIKCGVTGWCMEVMWTALGNARKKDKKLIGNTSIWMFPIYGLGAVIKPISKKMSGKSILFRGSIYTLGIYSVELVSGLILKRKNCCPWNYKKCKLNFKGVIRLDYAPLWFCAGLILEKVVNKDKI